MGDDTLRTVSCLFGTQDCKLHISYKIPMGYLKTLNGAEPFLSLKAQGPVEPELPALQE